MNAEEKPNSARIALIFGTGITAMLILYFMVATWLGFVHNYYFRIFNAVFMFAGIVSALKYYKRNYRSHFDFWKGFFLGLLTSFVAVGFFSIFVAVYLQFIDLEFLKVVKEQEAFGQHLYPATIILTIFAEGLGSGLIITFGTMLYQKDSRTKEDKRREREDSNN